MEKGRSNRLISKIRSRRSLKSKKESDNKAEEQFIDEQEPLSTRLTDNESKFRSIYNESSDVTFRSFYISKKDEALLIYIEGLSNVEEIDNNALSPLMKTTEEKDYQIDTLIKNYVSVSSVKEVKTFSECIQEISSGNPVIIIDQQKTGLSLGLAKSENRSIDEPEAETVERGPREGFIENLAVNTSLLRRRIRSPDLKVKTLEVGKYTKTKVVIAYIEGIADQSLVDEVNQRISRVSIDGVTDSGVLEEFIEDNPYSPFPQILTTERTDAASSSLLEGRVVILVDGSPISMVVPATLYSLLQASEDYYERFLIATAIRWLRYIFLITALLLPSLYVAILTFHQEMIPTSLLISIAGSREQVPFPAIVEALMMEIAFEALREAGLRLPKQIGSAVSIVGALIIGEAAVSAGIISAPMVIVVAVTGVASFTIPRYSAATAIRMLRFLMILLSSTLGLLGIMLGLITIIIHLASLRSFGEAYLSPMAPMKRQDMKDVLIRAPWWKLNTRPHLTGDVNKYRQSGNQKPSPTRGED